MSGQTANYGVVTNEEIAKAFHNTNFGSTNYREILLEGARKVAVGSTNGWTLTTILRDLKLTVPTRDSASYMSRLTEHGLAFIIKESATYREAIYRINHLEAQLAEAQADARRYRYLKDKCSTSEDWMMAKIQVEVSFIGLVDDDLCGVWPDAVNKAIDAALSQEKV